MKKLLAVALFLAFLFTLDASAKLGQRENFNASCGTVYGWEPDECTVTYELFVYIPLELDCPCEEKCIGYFTPNMEQDVDCDDLRCTFTAEGQYNYWFEAVGKWTNDADAQSLTSADGQVTLSAISWQTRGDDADAWVDITHVDGYFDEDFRLDGQEVGDDLYEGQREFTSCPGHVSIGSDPVIGSPYYFHCILWVNYNF